jgi:hypothetical protein
MLSEGLCAGRKPSLQEAAELGHRLSQPPGVLPRSREHGRTSECSLKQRRTDLHSDVAKARQHHLQCNRID